MPLVTLTSSPPIWTITLTSPPDNRLSTELIGEFMVLLDDVEKEWRGIRQNGGKEGGQGSLIITGDEKTKKFFSNGLDFMNSLKNPNFHGDIFNPFILRILSFPIPTICAMNGHSFAAGFLLALACDFRVMTDGRGWACMNEIDFGAPLPPMFACLLATKLPSQPPFILRDTALGRRFTPDELLKHGIVDHLSSNPLDKAMEIAKEVGGKAKTGVWGLMKEELYRQVFIEGKEARTVRMPQQEDKDAEKRLSKL